MENGVRPRDIWKQDFHFEGNTETEENNKKFQVEMLKQTFN